MIHATAVIDPAAQVDPAATIGPYAVVDAAVSIGADCRLGPHVYITGRTQIGAGNRFFAGCVIGEAPQDLKYKSDPTQLIIGDNNIFREHVTVHRSNQLEEATTIGSGNFFMAQSHVGHNSQVGNQIIMANGAVLGGHVQVADRAFISATCMLHQFVRVGTLALMQGGSGISKDLPPFCLAVGNNTICGLNTIGLRRAGLLPEERLELRKLYHLLFRSRRKFQEALAEADANFSSRSARLMIEFIKSSKRGVCFDAGLNEAEE